MSEPSAEEENQPEQLQEEERTQAGSGAALNTAEFETLGAKSSEVTTRGEDETPPTTDTSSSSTATTTTSSTALPFVVFPELAETFLPLGILNERQVDGTVGPADVAESNSDSSIINTTSTAKLELDASPTVKEFTTMLTSGIMSDSKTSSQTEASLPERLVTTESASIGTISAAETTSAIVPAATDTPVSTETTVVDTSTQSSKRLKLRGHQFKSSFSSTTTVVPLETEATRRTSFVPTAATEGRRPASSTPR